MEEKIYEKIEENSLKNENLNVSNNHGNLETDEKLSDSSHFKRGHWSKEEHQKFIEGIFIYGNDWKSVQNHIVTRNSTQARSHAQKFFQRMKKKLKIHPSNTNVSKQILYNFFQECIPERDVSDENKRNLMKIIETFTELPLKKKKGIKLSQSFLKSNTSSQEKRKMYFNIRKVEKSFHEMSQKRKKEIPSEIIDENICVVSKEQFDTKDKNMFIPKGINQLGTYSPNFENQSNLMTILPINQPILDRLKGGFIVFPNNISAMPQKKFNLLNFPPNQEHLEIPLINSKGNSLQKSTSLLQFILDNKKQNTNHPFTLYEDKISKKTTDIPITNVHQEFNLGLYNESNNLFEETNGKNRIKLEKQIDDMNHNPFKTDFDDLKDDENDEDMSSLKRNMYSSDNTENEDIFSMIRHE